MGRGQDVGDVRADKDVSQDAGVGGVDGLVRTTLLRLDGSMSWFTVVIR